jgi:hypothetical protein
MIGHNGPRRFEFNMRRSERDGPCFGFIRQAILLR